MNKIIQKYKNSNVAIKAALWFTICNLLQKGITMISMPIFTRLLSTEQYGVLTIYNSWYSIISIIVTLNLAGGVIFNARQIYILNARSFNLNHNNFLRHLYLLSKLF